MVYWCYTLLLNSVAAVPPSPPRSLNITHVDVDSLELTWNAPSRSRRSSSKVDYYTVSYSFLMIKQLYGNNVGVLQH